VERLPARITFANLADDMKFEASEMQVVTAQVRDGRVELASGEAPLIVTADRGRGRITCLLFSPSGAGEILEKPAGVLGKLAEVPGNLYASSDFNRPGGWSSDGIFGQCSTAARFTSCRSNGFCCCCCVTSS